MLKFNVGHKSTIKGEQKKIFSIIAFEVVAVHFLYYDEYAPHWQ